MVAEAPVRSRGQIISQDLACALDPAKLATRAGLILDPWQQGVLRGQSHQTLLNCSRQSGKSLTSALTALYTALYRPGSLTLCLSPTERQSAELLGVIRALSAAVPETQPVDESTLRLAWPSGSRIIALPGGRDEGVRGYSKVALLIVDEAARCSDLLYQSVRPMLAVSGGRLILLSTPFGKRGFFWHEWENGGPHWQRVCVPAAQCPRIPKDWLARERAAIGTFWASQEYDCEFIDSLSQVFSTVDIMRAVSPAVQPLFEEEV